MRPPKRILLAGDDGELVSALSVLLRIHGHIVIKAESAIEAHGVMLAAPIDLLLVVWPFAGAQELMDLSKAIDSYAGTLLVAPDQTPVILGPAIDSALFKGHCSSAEILERVKVLTARKRGPKGPRS